jgi:hypothetical protein
MQDPTTAQQSGDDEANSDRTYDCNSVGNGYADLDRARPFVASIITPIGRSPS